MKTMIAS